MQISNRLPGWKPTSVLALAALLATGTGCGSTSATAPSIGTVDNAAELQELMDTIALPMASLFTQFSAGAPVRDGADATTALTASVSCPSGGTATYSNTGTPGVTFASCDLGGIALSGILHATLSVFPGNAYSVIFGPSTLTLSGGATGTFSILSGTIQGTTPVTDANTYWQITVSIGGGSVCAWSGGGTCPI